MPTTPSQLEISRSQQRSANCQYKFLRKAISKVRGMVENALSLNEKAGRIESQIRDFDADTDGFQARAAADRRDLRLIWVFWATILAYSVLEFMTSGDIAEMLACQMAPHFGIDPATGETPIWLRRAAGVGFVGAMLLATLLTKLITGWFAGVFKSARAALQPGEDQHHRILTLGIWSTYLTKLAYVAAIAALYVWLYGFAQQRAAFMADMAVDQKDVTEWSDLGFTIQDGTIETNEATPDTSVTNDLEETSARLAGAVAVFYAIIVLLHILVLALPVPDLTREYDLSGFKRGAAERKAANLREAERQTLRDIYEDVRISPDSYQSHLVEASEPVHAAINQLYGRRVIGIAGVEPAPPAFGGSTSSIPPEPWNPNGSNGKGVAHGTNGHSHVAMPAEPINGANGHDPIDDNGSRPVEDEEATVDWDADIWGRRTT